MDPAKVLAKWGWKPGQGLGREENGIKESIQVKKRKDASGIGTKEDWSNRWESIYDKAAKSVIVFSSDDDNDAEEKTGDVIAFRPRKKSKQEKKSVYGGCFVRSVTLLQEEPADSDSSFSDGGVRRREQSMETLYRTRMSGKLRRLRQHELGADVNVAQSAAVAKTMEKKHKQTKKKKRREGHADADAEKAERKKKKKRKRSKDDLAPERADESSKKRRRFKSGRCADEAATEPVVKKRNRSKTSSSSTASPAFKHS